MFKRRPPVLWPPAWLQRQAVRVEVRPEFVERLRIDASFEIDDFLDRVPEFDPTPTVEFGRIRLVKIDAVLVSGQAEQEPSLLLPDT